MNEIVETKSELEVRDFDDLERSFHLADSIVTKNYLSKLDQFTIIEPENQFDHISNTASLFRVKKLVYDRDENNLQKLVNAYSASVGFNSSIVMVINSNGKTIDLYLGTVGADNVDTARASAKALSNNLIGNFPGSLGDFEEIALNSNELEVLLDICTQSNYENISSVSGVGSPRTKDDPVDNKNFIQGIEKLMDTMQGREYSAIFIANIISRDRLEDIRAEYELLYSQLAPFLKSDLTFNESSSEGITKTLTESLSKTLTKSRSSALSSGTSKSTAHTEGRATTHTDSFSIGGTSGGSAGINLGMFNAGTHKSISLGYSHSISRTKSWADTTTFGTTETQTSTIGESEAKGEIESRGKSESENHTTGRGLQITYENKTIKNLLERIDEQLERLKEAESFGIFAAASYFLAPDPATSKLAASSYKALINGNYTHVESANINFWQNNSDVDMIKRYLRQLRHPVFRFEANNEITPATIVTGRELAVQMNLPKRSLPGVSVIETAPFGRNIVYYNSKGHRFIGLGNLYHMGKDEEGPEGKIPVRLDLDSLTMHTFITGSTGKGKSNAIYSIIERVLEAGNMEEENAQIHFLVVEPAKGEYKNKFGNYKNVSVYGTNEKFTDLIRINPFSFPEEIHILEHIDRLIEIFNVCWPMYAAMPAVLKDAVERSYINAGWDLETSVCKYKAIFGENLYPSFIDVLKMINVVMEESKYSADSKGDYTGALCTRINSLTNGIYGKIFSADELSNEELFDSNVIVDLSRVGSVETKSLIMGLLVMKMQEYRMAKAEASNSKLKHLTVLEEAHNLLKRTSTDQSADSANLLGKSVEMLANSIAEMRTYGEGFIIADQAPGLMDMAVIRNTNTKIILGLPDMSDRELVGKAASLNDNQILELSKLKTGVAAVYQNNWLEPVLCHIYPCRNDEVQYKRKSVGHTFTTNEAKTYIVRYLMLKTSKKLELNSDVLTQLEKTIYKLPVSSDIKVELMRYQGLRDSQLINSKRRKIIYNLFNVEKAINLYPKEKSDISVCCEDILNTIGIEMATLSEIEKYKLLADIVYEYADKVKTAEADALKNDLIEFVSGKIRGIR